MENVFSSFIGELVITALRVLLIIIISAVAGALIAAVAGGGLGYLSERKKRLDAVAKTADSYVVNGKIADAEAVTIHEKDTVRYHHKFAVRYADENNTERRAYLGISTTTPLPYRVDDPIPLRIMPVPVLTPLADAFDPNRGADGKLPGLIAFRSWLGRPVDETGTVMPEEDYIQLMKDLEAAAENDRSRAFRWFILGSALTLLAILMLSSCGHSVIENVSNFAS
ncbi:MAG: hypothetical protein IKH27_04145 [Oscillospiraceae bacterium]|nr:hypothetical protein [Oscillospiraceae bacterium]